MARSLSTYNLIIIPILLFVFLPKAPMALQQSINNQTHVSSALATHLLSKKYPDSNVVFSPFSIQSILSLVSAGSEGQTLNQILDFLKIKTSNDLHSLYSQLVPLIFADGSPSGGPQLSFVSGGWVDKTFSLKPSFKQALDTVYKAACKQFDFKNKAGEIADEVNLWAKKQTDGLIKEILPADAIDSLTRLIFANAVHFKGAWSQKFDKSMTTESDFHLLDGNKVQVPFMTSMEAQFVRKYDDFKVLGLPYSQGQDKRKFTMYFFLPDAKDGLQSLVEKISSTSDFFDRHIPRHAIKVGQFFIPKFNISFEFKASDILKEMGLVLPFSDGEADFTKMVDLSVDERLHVSEVYHKSFLEVNEVGTEASTLSVASMALNSMTGVDFVADHPFMFVIREDVTGVVLFMGQVVDPRVS